MIPSTGKMILGAAIAMTSLLLAGCDSERNEADRSRDSQARSSLNTGRTLRLVYPEWSSEVASAHLFQAVLQERMGYEVQLVPVTVENMWQQVASGEADILTGAWLPTTHRHYYAEYGDSIDDLGPNLTGARIGLMVPVTTPGRQTDATGRSGRELVTIRSIPALTKARERFGGRIFGIESGAGVMARTRDVLDAYGLRRYYRLVETDEARMIERVAGAINRGDWIVFTGWKPHWIFERYNVRFLDDPKDVFGDAESIHTMVRSGLQEDMPDAYAVLSRISYDTDDIERLMRWIQEDANQSPYEQAVRWVELHADTVDAWVGIGE